MNLSEKDRARFQFLKELHDVTDGNMRAMASMWDIGASVGLDRKETGIVFDYLKNEGLAAPMAIGGAISITHAGIVEVEQAERTPQQATEHFPPNIINIHGDATGVAIQVGNTNSTQTANITLSAQDVEGLVSWIGKLKGNIPNLGLSQEDSQAMARSVTALESETQENEPDKSVLKTMLGRVQSLLKSVGTHMVADELLKELPTVMHHLHL